MEWESWVAVIAALLSLAALIVGLTIWRTVRASERRPLPEVPKPPTGHLVFIVNPIKKGAHQIEELARQRCRELGLREPVFRHTTEAEPGTTQARQALEEGAGLVVACGGDGTVRAVATGMADSGVPMGLIPLGTGNLLARNLALPLSDLPALMDTALTGRDHAIDIGRMDITDPDGRHVHSGEVFLVIGGMGFDAAMVDDTDARLKKRVGWVAYFLGGVKHLHSKRLLMQLTVDGTKRPEERVRTVLVGNCGLLPARMILIPDAVIDDGELDLATVDTRGGLVGWATLLGKVALQGVGVQASLPYTPGSITHERVRDVVVRCEHPHRVEVDGDVIGPGLEMHAWVEPKALVVRIPR